MPAAAQPSSETIQQRLAYAIFAMWLMLPVMIGMDAPDPALIQSLAVSTLTQFMGGALVFTMLRSLGKGMALLVVSILLLVITSAVAGTRFLV